MPVVCGSRDDGGWAWGLPTSNLETAFKTAGDEIRLKWTIIKTRQLVCRVIAIGLLPYLIQFLPIHISQVVSS